MGSQPRVQETQLAPTLQGLQATPWEPRSSQLCLVVSSAWLVSRTSRSQHCLPWRMSQDTRVHLSIYDVDSEGKTRIVRACVRILAMGGE